MENQRNTGTCSIKLFEIFKIFFIIGFQLLGGGYVIVPLLKKYLVDERCWINNEELVDFFAMCQCIPGIIAGNIAVFVGYKLKGIKGALVAILGIVIPCFVMIIIFAQLLAGIADIQIVQNIFKGIRVAVVVLIIMTIKDLWKESVNSKFSYILFFIILTGLLFLPISPTVVIVFAGIISYIFWKYRRVANV